MRVQISSIVVFRLVSFSGTAQVKEQSTQTQVEFVSVLCSGENTGLTQKLLTSHPQLVDDQLWRALVERAAASFYGPRPEESLTTYEIAIQVANQLHSLRLKATTYYYLARTYSGLNQLLKAVETYEKSRVLFEEAGLPEELAGVLADLGRLYFILEDYGKAARYSEQSLAHADIRKGQLFAGLAPVEFAKATALATLADLHLRDGNYDEAVQELQTALALHEQLNQKDSYYRTFIADDHQTLGRVYTASGDYNRALVQLNQALTLVKTFSDPDSMANLLNSIGVLYLEQEDYAQARKSLDDSLQIYLSINKQKEAARVQLNLGVIEQRQSKYDEALLHFKRSLEAAKVTKIADVEIAAGEGIGVVLTARKDFAGALHNLNASLELAKAVNDKTRQTELLWRSAETYYEMGNYERAVAYAESALSLARASHLPKLVYLTSTTLGQSYAAQNKLELATQTLRQAVDQLETLRDEVAGNEVEAQIFFENKVAPYHSLVNVYIKQEKPLDALLFAEQAKGRVLLDVVSRGKSDPKVLTKTEKEESQRLNRKISEFRNLIKVQQADSSALKSFYQQLDAARLEYRSFQDAMYMVHPSLRIRTEQTASLTEADLSQLTRKDDVAYLEYIVSDQQVYLFVLTLGSKNGRPEVKVYPIGIKPDDLEGKVNQFHQRLADRHPEFDSLALQLYASLIEPAEGQLRGIRTICIVPDSFLWNLPFQALLTATHHYLIEDRDLYYAPSLSVLRQMHQGQAGRQKTDASLIAFGNPTIGKNEQRDEEMCPLPQAEIEVSSISTTFRRTANKVLIGREATEKTFKALAPDYATIHLATHGVIDNRQPLYSYLLLTKTEGDPDNDGLLEAREIMNMNLNADLVVLSACETANGRISPGEGVIGTSWAFFVAGTRSMLVSQWKVNSASTSQLMINFYQALSSTPNIPGGKKAQSLQEATLRLMKNDRYRHPFYWAGFVLIGNGD